MIHFLVVFMWLIACAVQDLIQRQIANSLTFGAAALALLYMLITGHTWLGASAGEGGWALLIALVLTLPGYALNKLGAGDVKLLIALALATDRQMLLGTFIGAGLGAGLWYWLAPKFRSLCNQRLSPHCNKSVMKTSKKLPFAPFLLFGFTVTSVCIP
ncbi:prepilin peptidase [Pseudomonas psychrophila]|uniref:prepilin peptidase n=1 Tax=Pseudomonas psychrophila TaxID=122355 RepID=UPI000317A1D5|nr:prepilin peptidase [Pseudomonas psychrophila]